MLYAGDHDVLSRSRQISPVYPDNPNISAEFSKLEDKRARRRSGWEKPYLEMDIRVTNWRHEAHLRRRQRVVLRYPDVDLPQPTCSPQNTSDPDCRRPALLMGFLSKRCPRRRNRVKDRSRRTFVSAPFHPLQHRFPVQDLLVADGPQV